MLYRNVCIESMGYVIPDRVVTSEWFEEQLEPVYRSFRIRNGYIEHLTGIRERRWWSNGAKVSDGAALAAERAIERAGIDKAQIGCLINASVCHDYVEPATAVIVHHKVGLSPEAMTFDLSNACLGFLNGMVMAANMIELGQIEAGLVVAAEDVREGQLKTIERLQSQPPSRKTLKGQLASLTLGSGAVAMLLTHTSTFQRANGCRLQLLGGASYGESQHHEYCVAGHDWMVTDSSALLREGIRVIAVTWEKFKAELGWDNAMVDKVFSHQVSEVQRQIALRTLGIGPGRTSEVDIDYPTLYELGNIASVSAPISMAIAQDGGFIEEGDRICLLGVGSGISSVILGIESYTIHRVR